MLNQFCARHLRLVLWLDAGTCLGFGLGCLIFTAPVSALTGVPVGWLEGGGIICLLAAALVLFTVRRAVISPALVTAIAGINLLWAAASVLGVALGWIEPNLAGKIAVIGQGIAVLLIAEAQLFGLKGQATPQAA